jgi:hypothetical protein
MRRALVLVPLLVAGCGGDPYKVAPVSGKIMLNGKPLAKASVTFSPVAVGGNIEPGPSSTGKTDAEGRFTLTLIGKDGSGAVVGKHKVRVAMLDETDTSIDLPDKTRQLPLEYNGQTKLTFDVPAGGTDKADFDLKIPVR